MDLGYYLTVMFGKEYRVLKKGEHNDDRRLFVNMYEILQEATQEFYSLEIKNNLIQIAFNKEFDVRFKELEKLLEWLKENSLV